MKRMGSPMKAFATFALALVVLFVCAAPASSETAPRPLPALAPAADDALTRAREDGRLSEAEYALERARSLFRLGSVRREYGDVERLEGHDATLVLRDLAVRLRDLAGAERTQAERLLARPAVGGVPVGNGWTAPPADRRTACGADICFHWVVSTADAPPAADGDADGIADWVEETASEFEYVWAQEIDTLGYREPESDADSANDGGDGRLDIYLDDLGFDRVFGYCTTDDPQASNPAIFAVSAYCVVDNDYSAAQYGTRNTPEEFLQVTAAHELQHASQFAYDWLEDHWLMEGTATNMEETVYPAVNDNIAFLRIWSPLTRPHTPLDRAGFGDSEYGSWIFWRYLEEKVAGGDPTVVREIWARAAAALPTDPDDYSLRAVVNVLRADGIHFADEFIRFGVTNRRRDYLDGPRYPVTPTHGSFRLGPVRPRTGWRTRRLDHLSTLFFSFRPRRNVAPGARLGVNVDLDAHGGRARLIVFYRGGAVSVRTFRFRSPGFGVRRVDFGRGRVNRVDLVISNGSSRTSSCFNDRTEPFYSCFGFPRDDDRLYAFRATLR
jgi:hypothetical protein